MGRGTGSGGGYQVTTTTANGVATTHLFQRTGEASIGAGISTEAIKSSGSRLRGRTKTSLRDGHRLVHRPPMISSLKT